MSRPPTRWWAHRRLPLWVFLFGALLSAAGVWRLEQQRVDGERGVLLSLATDHPRAARQRHSASRHSARLSVSLSEAIRLEVRHAQRAEGRHALRILRARLFEARYGVRALRTCHRSGERVGL